MDARDRAAIEALRTNAAGIQRVVKGKKAAEVNEALRPKSEAGRGILGECHPRRFQQERDPTIG
ncbi:hypothetical protein CFB52_012365 [Burkholderia sp. AU18528]|nr:hypothetical protein WS84_04050 [Burkholderia anthina]OXI22764.1 hypothetical protein CFB35_12480 [Burkholderia sp. AU16482]PHP88298.1 hypothetical protein CFB52_012365 [Burkholderia sp. AU18528]KVH11854.1 hypothetical protein WS85_13850 [Burkholderia anthina]KVM90674.1 hypothetical protein WT06_16835 [Burkholderia anthina]